MTDSMKIMRAATTDFLLLFGSLLHADEFDDEPCFKTDDPGCFPFCPPTYCPGVAYLFADALYLRAEEGGLSGCGPACIIDEIDQDGFSKTRVLRHSRAPHPKWDWGYRVGAGLRFCESPWAISAAWTHFEQGTQSLNCEEFNPTKWKLDLNYVDALLDYRLCLTSTIRLKFFGGARGALFKQHVRTNFTNHIITFQLPTPTTECFFTSHCSKQHFKGVGGLVGVEGNWDFGCGFNLFANGDVGCMYGRYNTKLFTSELTGSTTFITDHSRRQQACQFFIDATFGLRWKVCLCDNIKLTFQLGVEQHTFFNHNYIGDNGNLSLYGGTAGLNLEY